MPKLTDPVVAPGALARLPQPILGLDDFQLRPWRPSDAAALAEAYSDLSIQRWHVRSMSEDEAAAWIERWRERWRDETGAGWAMATAAGVLGQISLRRLSLADGDGEVSYWVLPAARGRHVATRGLRALTGWLFAELNLHRLELTHSTLNPASCRVATNAGYRLEGTKRGEALHTDGWHDMHLHGRLLDDPEADIRRAGATVG